MAANPEQLAAEGLVDYLRLHLPAKVAAVNATRAAVLKTPGAGPWSISGGRLILSAVSPSDTGVIVQLPTGGAVTAAAIAAAINTADVGNTMTASADADGRLVVTSDTAPAAPGTSSFIGSLQHPNPALDGNVVLGWDIGGESVTRFPVLPPTYRGIHDRYPVLMPDGGIGLWVVLADRKTRPWPDGGEGMRRGESEVTFNIEVLQPEMTLTPSRSAERISAAVRAVRETLLTVRGRQLGNEGTIIRLDILDSSILARSIVFNDSQAAFQGGFDLAALTVAVRVFQTPT